jgi:hypothetical protein
MDEAGERCRAIRVDGAKRLRRSRWERGKYERVTWGGVRPLADAGGYFHEDQERLEWNTQGQLVAEERLYIKTGKIQTQVARPCSSTECVGTWTVYRKEMTGRASAWRANLFNLEEQRSSLFRSYGPPLREEQLRSFWS